MMRVEMKKDGRVETDGAGFPKGLRCSPNRHQAIIMGCEQSFVAEASHFH